MFVVFKLIYFVIIKVLCGCVEVLGVEVVIMDVNEFMFVSLQELGDNLVGVMFQYFDRFGNVVDF